MDNPPQTRYLLPLARAFEEQGCPVILTARDYGDTFAILRRDDVPFVPVGGESGPRRLRKVAGVLYRSEQLLKGLRATQKPDLLLSGSRSAVLAARRLGVPSFVVMDYEFVDVFVYRFCGSTIVHPDVIPTDTLAARGLRRQNLMAFAGLKEDFSFAATDVEAVPPLDVGGPGAVSARILFRPPAEESHYYTSESRRLAMQLLRHVAAGETQVIFSPRYDWQVRDLEEVQDWTHDPVVLDRPADFIALLKAVDAVISAGGTMLREAAFLGIPAYSIFRSRIGAVDRYLASLGRLSLLSSTDDFATVRLDRRPSLRPLRQGRDVLDGVVRMILERARAKL
jgi:predicted glycosyltransferase